MTKGRENSGFHNDNPPSYRNIENQPTRTRREPFKWEGEFGSKESILIDGESSTMYYGDVIHLSPTTVVPSPYKELFKCSPEWCKFFWISCLCGLPGRAISGFILAERMKVQKYPCIKFLLSATIGMMASVFFILVVHGVVDISALGPSGGLLLHGVFYIGLVAQLFLFFFLIRQRKLFTLKRESELEENLCESWMITCFCTPCSHGQMAAYTKIHDI